MKTSNYYAYIYYDPSKNNEPIYVGKGKAYRSRYHLSRKDDHPLVKRLTEMKVAGIAPVIKEIYTATEELAYQLETALINSIGRVDLSTGPLLNLADGGRRVGNFGPETILKLKAKKSDVTRSRMSATRIGTHRSSESIAKQSASMLGHSTSDETKAKMSLAKTGKKRGPYKKRIA